MIQAYSRYEFHSHLSRLELFLRHNDECLLSGYPQGPALRFGGEIGRTPVGADRPLHRARRSAQVDESNPLFHHHRSLERVAPALSAGPRRKGYRFYGVSRGGRGRLLAATPCQMAAVDRASARKSPKFSKLPGRRRSSAILWRPKFSLAAKGNCTSLSPPNGRPSGKSPLSRSWRSLLWIRRSVEFAARQKRFPGW